MAELRWGAATDPGRIRPDNEDNLLAEPTVFVVADGMGGHRAGEVASALAVDLLRARLTVPGADLDDVVAAIADVNAQIYRAATDNPEQQGMGTTVTALIVIRGDDERQEPQAAEEADTSGGPGEQLALVNVGDSRTYLLRHGRLRRVTVDHSYVQELVATGHITDDEARTHPRRNIVTRALGIDPGVRVDAWTLPLVRGDRFLLCSDGLVDEVRDDEIVNVLGTVTEPQRAADELVALANRQGGRDNVTVVVVDVLDGAEAPDPDTELDLEPAWEDTGTGGTWAVDEPEAEATTFEDLAALVSGEDLSTVGELATQPDESGHGAATVSAEVVTAEQAAAAAPAEVAGGDGPPSRRKRRLVGFLGGLGVLAVLVLALVIASAYGRRGYFVAFDAENDVVLYRGRNGGFLWFDPTVEAPTDLNRDALDDASIERVEREPSFDSRRAAERFVTEQLETTTTTSTTTTTTTSTTTTTVPATITPPAIPAP